MKTRIEFEDKGSRTVSMELTMDTNGKEQEANVPTPAAILAMATKALFENGMLARMGQVALEGISKGQHPADAIAEAFKEKTND